jgi:enoyl-CoA hydratase
VNRIHAQRQAPTSIEHCRKPVLAAIHGACIGGGIDLITCCDMRYASAEAYFSIREIDVGMTADVGTLQRLPKLVPDGIVRELAYTGRRFDAAEAREIGLVNRIYDSPDDLQRGGQRSPSPSPPSRRCRFAVSRKWSSTRAIIRWPMA